MPVSTVRKIDSLQFGTGGTVFNGFADSDLSTELQQIIEYAAGQAHPTFVGTREVRPMARVTAHQLGALLVTEGLALGGKEISNLALFNAAAASTGHGKASRAGSHYRYLMSVALIYWDMVRLSHNGTGTVGLNIMAVYDGTNIPVAYSGATALPAATLPNEYFGAGPCYLNGTQIDGIQDISVSSGYRALVLGADSEPYPSYCGIEQTQPEITVQTTEPIAITTLTGLDGKALVAGSGGFVAYGRKYLRDTAGGLSRVADATTEHLRFEMLYGQIVPLNVRGEGSRAVADTFKVTGRANAIESTGSNPLGITLAAIA